MELLKWAFLPEEHTRTCINQRESKSAPINTLHQAALHRTHSGRMFLKKCGFGCKGNISIFSFSKRTQRYVDSGCSLFFRAAVEFHKYVCCRTFYKQGAVRVGFAHCLILKAGATPAIKDPGHDSEMQTVCEAASNVCVLLVIALKCSSLFSSAHAMPPGALLCPERIGKLYLSFINMTKLNAFWRYEGCSTTPLVLKINMKLGETVCNAPFNKVLEIPH